MANSLLRPWNSRMEMSETAAVAAGFSSADRDSNKSKSEQKQERGHETVKQRVRKNGKSSGSTQKKAPQRGLGVAQLERLRLQERWKSITEINQAQRQPRNNNIHDLQLHYQFPFPLADQHSTLQQPSLLHPYKLGNGTGSPSGGGGGGGGVRYMFPSDEFQIDRLRVLTQEPPNKFQNGNLNLYETSNELSSTQTQNLQHQMIHCRSDQCDICKKKHIHGGNLGPRKYPEIMPSFIDRNDYLGLNLGTNRRDMGVDLNPASFSATGVREEEEISVAIHPLGKMVGSSNRLEYEFFPEKVDPSGNNCNSNSNNGVCGCSSYTDYFFTGVAAAGGETSVTANTTNSLDLSLKLSC